MAPRSSEYDDSERRMDRFEKKLDDLVTSVQGIQTDIAVIKASPVCSSPNMCLDLRDSLNVSHTEVDGVLEGFKDEISSIASEVQEIKNARTYAAGVLKPIVLVGAFLLTLLSGVASAVLTNKLSGDDKPAQSQQSNP